MKTLLIPALVGLAGCGSLADLTGGCAVAELDGPEPHVMGGVRTDAAILRGRGGCKSPAFVPCALLDLPLSAAVDVVLLPVTVPVHLFRPRPQSAAEATSP
jgi:uncharacterized protein YceK